MSNYSKRKGIIVSLIISFILLVSILFILKQLEEKSKKEIHSSIVLKTSQTSLEKDEKEDIKVNEISNSSWKIFISKINLEAPILEGTSQEILKQAVGHFESTNKWNGNVALAAHNRGYPSHFFQELKRLEIGDSIIYQTEQGKRTYHVTWKGYIKETDFSYLKETKENILTLITCVENVPEYRLCVQAQEIKI